MINIVQIAPENNAQCLKTLKTAATGIQDTLFTFMANNNVLLKNCTLTYTEVIRHEIATLKGEKDINLSTYIDKILQKNNINTPNRDTYFGIANLTVNGCTEACLRFGYSCLAKLNTNISNAYWLLSDKRCLPYKLALSDIALNFSFAKPSSIIDFIVTVEFDIVLCNFNVGRAYEWVLLMDVPCTLYFNSWQNAQMLWGNSPVASITVKSSAPINGITLDLNNFKMLNADCSAFEFNKHYTNQQNIYKFPFTYDKGRDCWTLQLQEFIDAEKNINYADCTINLSKLNNPNEMHASLAIDKQLDTEILLEVSMLTVDAVRCMAGLIGITYSK